MRCHFELIKLANRACPAAWNAAGWILTVCVCSLLFFPAPILAQPATEKPAETPADEAVKEEENTDSLKSAEEMPVPTAEQFRTMAKFTDWLVLKKDRKVIEILPMYSKLPRPGTLEALDVRIKRGVPKGAKDEKRLRDALTYLNVTLDLDNKAYKVVNPEYRIQRKLVEEILYWEDMLLKRIDEALDNKQVKLAYELLDRMEQLSPTWTGTEQRRHRLIFVEAGLRIDAREYETALVMLQELHGIAKNYSGLRDLLGEVVEKIVTQALETSDYRRTRHFLERLRRLEPQHPVLLKWSADLEARANEKIQQANVAARAAQMPEAIDRIEEAARIWPQATELASRFRYLSESYQRLRVGTLDSPSDKPDVPYIPSADVRRKLLTEARLFQPARMDDQIVRFETRLFSEWEPGNLGHSIQFRMLKHRGEWESQPAITAGTVVETIAHRLDPLRRDYDARIASSVDFLSVSSPFECRIDFRQAPLRPEALFAIPLDLSGSAGSLAPNGQPSWPFYLHSRQGRDTVYRRSRLEPPQLTSDRHVSEIIETRYDDYAASVQGLLRGEVSLLPRIAPADVRKFEQHYDYFTFLNPLPETHVLQFHPRSKWLSSRALRRALVYSLNRQQLLETIFLQEPEGRLGRVSSGPFARNSYASNPNVKPHRYDPILAYSLILGAKSELKTLPTLKMIAPRDPAVRAAVKEMIEHWNKLFEKQGLKVELLDEPPAGTVAGQIAASVSRGAGDSDAPAEWDIRYDTIRMAEPLTELWSIVAMTNATDLNSIQHIPTWLRQELLMLEQAGDMTSAREILNRLHKHIWAEVHLIPLWELNPVMVVRKTVKGIPQGSLDMYQGIEGWHVQPWYPRDVIEPQPVNQKPR